MENDKIDCSLIKRRALQFLAFIVSTLGFFFAFWNIAVYNELASPNDIATNTSPEKSSRVKIPITIPTPTPAPTIKITGYNENDSDSDHMNILIVSRRRSGSTWAYDVVESLLRDCGKLNIFGIYEGDHVTTIDYYIPFLNESHHILNKSKLELFSNTKMDSKQKYFQKRWTWEHLNDNDKFRYQAGIITSLFRCNYKNNFDTRIGQHHKQLCTYNGMDIHCSISELENICRKSEIILLKSILIDYRSLFYIRIFDIQLYNSLKFVMLIRNPFNTMESQLAAGMQFSLNDAIYEVCQDFYFNTVIPFLIHYKDYNIQLNGKMSQISEIEVNDYNNDSDRELIHMIMDRLFVIKYEKLTPNFVDITKLLIDFLFLEKKEEEEEEEKEKKDGIDDNNIDINISNIRKTLLSNFDNWEKDYFEKHSPQNCDKEKQKQDSSHIISKVKCASPTDKNALKKNAHESIRKQKDFNGIQSVKGCNPYNQQFNYTIPQELITPRL